MSPHRPISLHLYLAATAVLVAALLPSASMAEDVQATPEPPKIDVGGFIDLYYDYNVNKVNPLLRTFDVQHDAMSLSLLELNFSKAVTPESPVGFRADLDFGKTADLVAAYEPEDGGQEVYKHIQQAYVSLLTGRVQWDAGKFVTPIGAEVIESQDNWNYTRSILFGYAIPFYHVGVRAALPVNDEVTLGAQVLNGWNNSSELNGEKTLAVTATVKPSAKLTWFANYMMGKEAPATAEISDTRHLLDTTLSFTATPKLRLMANFDYGAEGDVKWWGVAAYVKYQVRPSWAAVGRFEYLDDTEGGFMTIGKKAQSLTLTSDHLLSGALKARLEYRLDLADGFFTKSDGSTRDSQSTVTLGLVYAFSGKI